MCVDVCVCVCVCVRPRAIARAFFLVVWGVALARLKKVQKSCSTSHATGAN
jgi:hypothetical protein